LPFAPFHLGPALLLGLALSFAFDLPTLLIASTIPDLEPLAALYLHISGYPLHGFFHSYLGSSILVVLTVLIAYSLRDVFSSIMIAFQVRSKKPSFDKILFTSFLGVYSHVFLDSFLYSEMMPFYPLQGNPLIDALSAYGSYRVIYGLCGVAFLLAIVVYVCRPVREAKT